MRLALSFLTVSQLTELIKQDLESNYRDIWVEGEISTLRVSPTGHYYFSLKDSKAQIKAVFFKGKARFFLRHLREGNKVICHGDLSLYQERGEFQIVVDFLEPRGKGEHFLRLELLKKKLAAEGLFDPRNKKPLPLLPKAIGVISSPRGAAIRDVIKVIEETFPRVHILLYPVSVQGERAPHEIALALEELNLLENADVIILARGGGTKEDLAAFNTEEVARAVASSSIPVISAVGHEIDTTLADLAADARAPTPSAAAQTVVAKAVELERALKTLEARMLKALQTHLTLHPTQLQNLKLRLEKTNPQRVLKEQTLKLEELKSRLTSAIARAGTLKMERMRQLSLRFSLQSPAKNLRNKEEELKAKKEKLHRATWQLIREKREGFTPLAKALEALSPLAILKRGYSITLAGRGVPVTAFNQVKEGEKVKVILHRGLLSCTVEDRKETLSFPLFTPPTHKKTELKK